MDKLNNILDNHGVLLNEGWGSEALDWSELKKDLIAWNVDSIIEELELLPQNEAVTERIEFLKHLKQHVEGTAHEEGN